MKDTFVLNIVHRPEMVPEYAEKALSSDKDNLTNKALLKESLDIFITQQSIAHKNGLKTTIQMTYASLFNDEAVRLAKEDHEKYGDEIALTLLGLPCEQFEKKYKTKDFCIWMFSMEDKKAIVDDVFGLFKEKFGFYPESTGSYFMDADLINYIKEKYPTVKAAVATCWEEGPKAYHTCNNSWYTFMDGGPWAPWIPSKINSHIPASSKEDDSGIVAIPHLSRDILACFDGNGSNFGTHPQNVLRGLIYDKDTWEFPYFYNLVDQYRHLGKFNDGLAYNMVFVGPGWMNKMGRWEAPYELLLKSYEDGIGYYGKLKKEGKLIDMTMSEFADFYRENKHYGEPEVALWNDILYGGNKQLFWYYDPSFRFCLDINQSGAMIDLRPYQGKLYWPTGIGTKHITDASYPYIIQANYRAGYFTHYKGEGTLKSCKLTYDGETVDLALCRTKGHVTSGKDYKILTLDPVTVDFHNDVHVTIVSKFKIVENSGEIETIREITNINKEGIEIELTEYLVGTYGTTEYAEDMYGITLSVGTQSIPYEYKCRHLEETNTPSKVVIPQVETILEMESEGNYKGYINEGYAFSPMFTLGVSKRILEKGEFKSCLKVKKAN